MNLTERRRLRLRLRDLAAGSAFSAVALSGSLPSMVTALFGVSFGLSLWGKRPFSNQRVWSVLALLAMAIVLFGLVSRGVLDLVVAAVGFATLVTAHRMLSEPTPATDQQVLLASLLLMAGAAALSGDVWYALCLLSFGVFACLSLGLAVIEGPVERDEDLPLAPVLSQVSVGVGVALVGGILFFILFPRLSWNVAARRTGAGLLGGTTGMTDRVRLGGGGDIKTSARVVLRAKLEPAPSGDRLDRYWVGRHFDSFDGREWRGTGRPGPARARIMLGEPNGAIVQRIELLPAYDSRTLVGLAQPVYFGPATALGNTGSSPVALIRVGSEEVRFAEDANAYTYVVHSRGDYPMLEDDPAVLEALQGLPAGLDPRVRELAARIAPQETRPEQIAAALERWLQSNLSYTLELPGEVPDPLTDFLFVRKEGHCEHFATALAVMLRTRGVPARVVGGFFGGERVGNRFVVRAGDAHAWVEAYSPVRGWMTFDATPDDGRGGRPQAILARIVDAYERLEELWRARVVDYSLVTQWDFVRQLIRPPQNASSDDDDRPDPGKPGKERTPTRALVFAVGAGLLSWLAWRRLTGPASRRHPAAGFLSDVERKLAALKINRRGDEDLEALSQRLRAEHHHLAEPVGRATRRYLEARFGQRPLSKAERRALLAALEPSRR
ncbi:MAG: transglutaminaseTgpA domain-containing protein [Archangium sp.]|nr:transglutaminaseTgpA domain-containing protein [Archangium sp.]